MPAPGKVNVLLGGRAYTIDESDLQGALDQGFKIESDDQAKTRATSQFNEERNTGVLGKATAAIGGGLRGATLGLSDAYIAATQPDYVRQHVQAAKEANPGISLGTEIAGAIAPALLSGGAATPAGLASRAGASIAKGGAGGIVRGIAGGAVEGSLFGAGHGVSELALSDQPIDVERATSVLSSNILFGAATGGVAGGLGKLAEKGLLRAKDAINAHLERTTAATGVADDLAHLDVAGIDAAEAAAKIEAKTAQTAERHAIVDDLRAYRQELKDSEIWIAAKGTKDAEIREAGAMVAKADQRVRNMLNNPKSLAENPQQSLSALQQQEHAYETLAAKAPEIRAAATVAHPIEGAAAAIEGVEAAAVAPASARVAALEKLPAALERNRALQEKLRGVIGPAESPRVADFAAARDAIKAREAGVAAAKDSLPARLLGGTVFGGVAGVVHALPGGSLLAPLLGAKASSMATNLVFGRLGAATAEAAKRTVKAIDVLVSAAPAAQRVAPVLATKVLSAVRYAPTDEKKQREATGGDLRGMFRARSAEIRSQVAPDQLGVARMRPEARAEIAKTLGGIRAQSPILADQMETVAARRLEFLASKLPKAPDLPMAIGADGWRASDFAMRQFARYAAAVEDPGAVEERLAHGTLTPEDVEAYKAVYPERAAELTGQLLSALSRVKKPLPYARRLALSMFTGTAVDPAMHPQIFATLQASFTNEPGTAGGTQAPAPAPAFGSVKKSAPEPTPAQARAQ